MELVDTRDSKSLFRKKVSVRVRSVVKGEKKSMNKYKVYGIGNSLLDYEYKVNDNILKKLNLEKGCMSLSNYDEYFKIHDFIKNLRPPEKIIPGGSVANSIYSMAQFGDLVCFTGRVSNDDTGNNFIECLNNSNVKTFIGRSDKNKSGECLVLITPDHERTMNTFLGASEYLSNNDINVDELKKSEYLLIEGYLVTSEMNFNVCKFALGQTTKNNIKTIFTLSDPNVVSIFRSHLLELLNKKANIIFCNEQEAMNFSQSDSLDQSLNFLKSFADKFVVTLGEKGSVCFDGNKFHNVATDKVEAKDFTGAGDMFLAAFMHSYCNDTNFLNATKFANYCAGKIIEVYGAKFNDESDYKNLVS